MRKLFLITNEQTAGTILESWFVQNVMLPEMPFGLEMDAGRLTDAVVVYLEIAKPKSELVATLAARGNKVVLYHMGDETGANYDRGCYLACDLVLRNYFNERIFGDAAVAAKTLWVPNGFKSGIGPRSPATLRRATQRRFLACFLGRLENPRAVGNERALFQAMAQRHPQDIFLQAFAGFNRGYGIALYSAAMEYALFSPCPAGNAAETIRLYDALELGCIPVSLRHPFLSAPEALQDPPFPILGSWEEFPEFLRRMRERLAGQAGLLDALQANCIDWWGTIKRGCAGRIAERLKALRCD